MVEQNASFLEIKGLNKWYGTHHVLKDINLQIQRGEKLVVCGPSGSGKSTLIRCINQLEEYQEGFVRFRDIKLEPFPSQSAVRAVRKNVGMVFQQFNLFPHLTVMENLILAPMEVKKESKKKAMELACSLLKRARIEDKKDTYPYQLSGGQQQRVAIVRSLCMMPELMLFDEPTSSLDPEMVGEVLDVMISLASEGMSMICVTHEMGFARRIADRILFMENGELVFLGDKDSFFSPSAPERVKLFLQQIY